MYFYYNNISLFYNAITTPKRKKIYLFNPINYNQNDLYGVK